MSICGYVYICIYIYIYVYICIYIYIYIFTLRGNVEMFIIERKKKKANYNHTIFDYVTKNFCD